MEGAGREREVPLEELPEALRSVKQEFPKVKIYKSEIASHGLSGKLCYMEHGAVMLYELGRLLWPDGKKFRVTIECDPEMGRFEARREDIT